MLPLVPREASKTSGTKLQIIFDSSFYHSKQLVFKYNFFNDSASYYSYFALTYIVS